MAGKLTPNEVENGATAGHNVANLNKVIQDAYPEAWELHAEITRLKKEHIEDLQKKLNQVWQTAKADTGMSIKAIKSQWPAYKLENESKVFIDEDAGTKLRDELKFIHNALQAGETADFIAALEVVGDTKAA